MTFEQLVLRTQRGRVLRARRRAWRDPWRYVAVTVLVTHRGKRAPGFIGREFRGGRFDPVFFGVGTHAAEAMQQGADWVPYDGLHHRYDRPAAV